MEPRDETYDLKLNENTWKFGGKKHDKAPPEEEGWCVSVGRPIREKLLGNSGSAIGSDEFLTRKKEMIEAGRATATPTINKLLRGGSYSGSLKIRR